jgi:lysophospholipase L1-like esterase
MFRTAGFGSSSRFLVLLLVSLLVLLLSHSPAPAARPEQGAPGTDPHWIGTWSAAPQPFLPGRLEIYRNRTLRLIAHASAGGTRVRIRVSNIFGDQPVRIGAAHIARRAAAADIDPASDRTVTFLGRSSATIPAGSLLVSDPVELALPALSDLAVSLFFPAPARAATLHLLALQTSYASSEDSGDKTGEVKFPVSKTIDSWPFLSGVDIAAAPGAAAIVAFGSSTTDGDGSTEDANHRWPDVLAERLQRESGRLTEIGVLNQGIIGNRLLSDSNSPGQTGGPFGAVLEKYGGALGAAGLARFDRDVLSQAGVGYVILALGVNDILFPGSFVPASQTISALSLIEGNRQLLRRAHEKGIRVIATTIPPFENATFRQPVIHFYTPEKEAIRQQVNAWIRSCGEFEGVIDFDEVLRDPGQPARILPAYDSDDHLHANDQGYIASGRVIPLSLFRAR